MILLNGWALWIAVAAIGLPPLIHWLTRPRPVRMPLSTIRFVQSTIQQRRTLHRLRDLLILALRMLAIALIGLAFARPMLAELAMLAGQNGVRTARVIVLDGSQSMAARVNGVERFERARALAGQRLGGGPDLRAGVVLAGARPASLGGELTANVAALRDELSGAGPLPEKCDLPRAVALAGELLSREQGESLRRELVIISDLQASQWGNLQWPALPRETSVLVESVAEDQTPANLAIVRVGTPGRAEAGRPLAIEVEVGNFSTTPRTVAVELDVADRVYRLEGTCPGGGSVVLNRELAPQRVGWIKGRAALVDADDALPADDVRWFTCEVSAAARYALLTRERADRAGTSSYYLQRVLEAQQVTGGTPVTVLAPSNMSADSLAVVDLLVINRPGTLGNAELTLVRGALERGVPIVYVSAEPSDAGSLDSLLQAAGQDKAVRWAAPDSTQRRGGLSLRDYAADQAPFKTFAAQLSAAVSPLRFTRGLDAQPTGAGLKEDVLAVYSDHHVCMARFNCGQGKLFLLNADLAEPNLALSPVFVPLVGEMVGSLLAVGLSTAQVECGLPVLAVLPSQEVASAPATLAGPAGSDTKPGELVHQNGRLCWSWAQAGPPGVYETRQAGKTIYAMATAIPSTESNLQSLTPGRVSSRPAEVAAMYVRLAGRQDEVQDRAWTILAMGCLVLMASELMALRWLRT